MNEKLTPIYFQKVPNSDSVIAVIDFNHKVTLVPLTKEDIASLREDIVNYYKSIGHIDEDYAPNVFKGIKPKQKPIDDTKQVKISAKLYKQFQQLYNKNKHLKEEVKRSHNEIKRLKQLISDSKKGR